MHARSQSVASPDGHELYGIGVQLRGELARYGAKAREFLPFLSRIWGGALGYLTRREVGSFVLYQESGLWRSRLDGS
jgi:hypothetical protein